MLRHASRMKNDSIWASDGAIGVVHDFLFDDRTWLLRWLVVDTGNVFAGRKVLLPPSALGHVDDDAHALKVRLTKSDVKGSPDIETDAPVSRRMEASLYGYYGWNPYWNTYAFMGDFGFGDPISAPLAASKMRSDQDCLDGSKSEGDVHLRSMHEMTGYHILARDGEIGHVADILIDDADWGIRYLVIETGGWWSGNKVLISPRSVRSVHWSDRTIDLDVDQQAVRESPAYDPTMTVDRIYGERHRDHYSRLRKVEPV